MIGPLPRRYVRKPDHSSEKSSEYGALPENERTTRPGRAGNLGEKRADGARAESRDRQPGLPQRQARNVRSKPKRSLYRSLSASGHEVWYAFFFPCRSRCETPAVAAISSGCSHNRAAKQTPGCNLRRTGCSDREKQGRMLEIHDQARRQAARLSNQTQIRS